MKLLAALAIALVLSACAATSGLFSSPEAQIAAGAQSVTAATTLATALLKNDKITVAQAKTYSGILHSASDHLKGADSTLVACRSKTASSTKTTPDPCRAGIEADIRLAVDVVTQVQSVLKGK